MLSERLNGGYDFNVPATHLFFQYLPMEEFNKIQGTNRLEIFKQLQKDKTFIKMHLLGKDYDRLTIITGIRTEKEEKALTKLIYEFQRHFLRNRLPIDG